MKAKSTAFCISAFVGLLSCSRESLPQKDAGEAAVVVNHDPAALRIACATGDLDDDQEAADAQPLGKSQLTGSGGSATDNVIKWQSGDKIALFRADGTAVPFTTEDNSATAAFVEDETGAFQGDTEGAIAFYPFEAVRGVSDEVVSATVPVEQEYTKQSFARGANLAIAKMTGGMLNFRNVCGYIRFVNPNNDKIIKIVLRSNGGEPLAGKVKVSCNDGMPAVSVEEGVDSIVVSSTDAFAKATSFYVTVLPGSFASGITVTVLHGAVVVGGRDYRIGRIVTNRDKMDIVRNTVFRIRNGNWDTHANNGLDPMMLVDGENGRGNMSTPSSKWSEFINSFGSEKGNYTIIATPDSVKGAAKGNTSEHVIMCSGGAVPSSTGVANYRLMPNFLTTAGSAAGQVDGTDVSTKYSDCLQYYNAIRFKMYIGDKIMYPRMQWGMNNITATSASMFYKEGDTNMNRPLCTPSYINGKRMEMKLLRWGTGTESESMSILNGDWNVVDDAWLAEYASAIKLHAWNEFVYSMSDVRGGGMIGKGNNYVRAHPYTPCDKENSKAYHASEYPVVYLDDMELCYVKYEKFSKD